MRSTHASYPFKSKTNEIWKKKEHWEPGCLVKGRNEPSEIR